MTHRVWLGLAAAFTLCGAAEEQPRNDLRNIRLGMQANALPTDGYVDIGCAGKDGAPLKSWAEFTQCAKSANGLHAVKFGYGDEPELAAISEDGQGTKMAGQPVLLTMLIDDSGAIVGLHAESDPHVRLFIKRRQHILGLQAMARYGEDGWACTNGKPTATQQPIGDSFVDQHCEKQTADRSYVVNRALYRNPELPITAFVSKADLTIMLKK